MISAKEMRKMARRWMEDHEPERVKARARRDTWGLVAILVGSLPMLVTVFLLPSEGVSFAEAFGEPQATVMVFASVVSFVLGLVLWVYLASRDAKSWIDYYFEHVYQG